MSLYLSKEGIDKGVSTLVVVVKIETIMGVTQVVEVHSGNGGSSQSCSVHCGSGGGGGNKNSIAVSVSVVAVVVLMLVVTKAVHSVWL